MHAANHMNIQSWIRTILSVLFVTILFAIAGGIGWYIRDNIHESTSPTVVPIPETPLDKYTMESLANTEITPGKIKVLEILEEEDEYTSYLISFKFDPDLDGKDLKTTTGMLNVPVSNPENINGKYPVVIMFRGYVDENIYETGIGTKNAAAYFASNGFITIAPDFLGYAESDTNASDIFESRFQTYTAALSLIETVRNIPSNPILFKASRQLTSQLINQSTINIWAHSNGGQVALTALFAKGYDYPTTLWAPVTKPFPYSVLYYTDGTKDRGKFIRKQLAEFEELYDADLYSIENHIEKLNAPLSIHQGTSDDAVPKDWTDSFVVTLNNLDKTVDYYTYPGGDHNLRPYWDDVVETDVKFFKSFANNNTDD